MVDVRALVASLLGVGLGVVLVAYPDIVVRAHTAGRLPTDRSGDYGADAEVPPRWRWVVRVAGVAAIGTGLAIARSAFL